MYFELSDYHIPDSRTELDLELEKKNLPKTTTLHETASAKTQQKQ